MSELLDYKKRFIDLGLCGKYKLMWDRAETKYDLLCLASDANGAASTADGAAFGWFMPLDVFCKDFAELINGEQVLRQKDGYTSEIYCLFNDAIKVRTTILLVLGCNCTITVPKNAVCEIYVAKSNVSVMCYGKATVYAYGCSTVDDPMGNVEIKEVTKSEWVK